MAIPASQPIKLPEAPKDYDKNDQDRTRRMIERALAQFGLGIARIGTKPAPSQPQVWSPQSPIIASATITQVSNSACIQLRNPATSGRNIVIYEMYVTTHSAQINQCLRMTSQPLNFTAVAPLPSIRMDERDLTSILGVLVATQGVTPFGLPSVQLVIQPPGVTSTNYREVRIISQAEGDQPIVLAPGQAIELSEGTTGSGPNFGAFLVWDEIAITAPLPRATSNNPTHYISAVMGGATVAAGNRNFVQLLNPSYSPKVLRVKSIRVFSTTAATRITMRKTREPLHVSATPASDLAKFADGTVADSIYGQVNSSTQPLEGTGAQWSDDSAFWFDKSNIVSTSGFPIPVLISAGAPIYLKPGSAIELAAGDTVQVLFANFIWDEVDL